MKIKKRDFTDIIDNLCSCGGGAPPDCCDACKIYHAVVAKSSAKVPKKDCECKNWARTTQLLFTTHHRNCPKYTSSIKGAEAECYNIIVWLLDGVQAWANDEDGIHPECYEAFKRAACFVGQPGRIETKRGG